MADLPRMTDALPAEPEDDLDDLLPDHLRQPASQPKTKGKALPVVRTAKQQAKIAAEALGAEQAEAKQAAQSAADAAAQRLAQIVNLHIAGFSLAEIGAQIGATADEVDRMLSADAARYVRSQPALRTYVRNFISGKYTKLLEAVWDEATDKMHREKLENQDRALRILKEMGNLHGAAAPTQAEIKVEAAPEAVEKLVASLAASQGLGYDASIFDLEPVEDEETGEIVHQAVEQSARALEVSGNAVEQPQPDDEEWGS